MTTFFTSDLHLDHTNVIKYCNRPFNNVDAMNDALIKNWNAAVKSSDTVYILGDFALTRDIRALGFAHHLNGQKHLVFGNHDKGNRKAYLRDGSPFVWCKDLAEIKVPVPGEMEPQRIVLCHYPMLTWNKSHHGAWQLHGHCHGTLKDDPRTLRIDVGVDCWGYAPVSFETLRQRMLAKNFKPVDHHGAD